MDYCFKQMFWTSHYTLKTLFCFGFQTKHIVITSWEHLSPLIGNTQVWMRN